MMMKMMMILIILMMLRIMDEGPKAYMCRQAS